MRSVSARDPNLTTIRLRVPLGIIYPEQLDILKEVALRYGDGRLHLTVRKTVEIPGIPIKFLGSAQALLSRAGWYANAFGNNVRNISACPGRYSCPQAQVDTQGIGLELDSALQHIEHLPAKVKIAIAGCPNGCTHPLVNDIGVVGVARMAFRPQYCQRCLSCMKTCREGAIQLNFRGEIMFNTEKCIDCGECASACTTSALTCEGRYFRLYLGGKMGRHPQFGEYYGDFVSITEVLEQVEKIIIVYYQYAEKDERLGTLIKRISMDDFGRLISECQPKQHLDCLSDLFLARVPAST